MVASTAAAPLADPSRLGGDRFDHTRRDEAEEEGDYGLFDLEEDGPVTSNTSSNNSPNISRVAEHSDASTTPAVDMQLLARRYNRTDSSSNILLMKRVGSTFFSVAGSVASDLDMLDFSNHHHYAAPSAGPGPGPGVTSSSSSDNNQRFVSAAQSFETSAPPAAVEVSCSMSDVLYHDIMLNIFAHMTATELAAFSETARRPNIDVHNYLRLQLERALLLDPIAGSSNSSSNDDDDDGDEDVQSNSHANNTAVGGGRRSSFLTTSVELGQAAADGGRISPITRRVSFHRQASSSTCPIAVCGAGILSRLATVDRAKAEQLVEEYRTIADTTSASTSAHSKGSHGLFGTSPALRADAAMKELQDRMAHHKGAASCAVVFTVMGAAANKLMTDGGLHMPAEAQQAATAFTLGCAGLGLVATRYGRIESDGDNATTSDGANANAQDGAAANMARRVQALLMRMPRPEEGGVFPMAIIERMSLSQPSSEGVNSPSSNSRRGKRTKRKDSLNAVDQYQDSKVDSSDEADHDDEEDYKSVVSSMEGLDISINTAAFPPARRRPTGCLGAYARILRRAADAVTEHVRSQRKEAFDRLSEEEKAQTTTAFIDACSSDDNLDIVEDLVRNVGVDVDGFYVGSDGTTETCGLHTAAFNDATEIMKFLCSGINERDPAKDGGLCDIDVVDSNKWSALHFAAGADSADGVRVLASFGAKMTEEAANGYTPYHWAERLSNSNAAEELKRLGADDRFVFSNQMPFLTSRFFALMPSRFFAMMPVATN